VLALGVLLAKGGGSDGERPAAVPGGPRTNLVCVAAVLLVILLIAAR
ncbi:hypothetical protein GT350_02885, partial [Streptomyces sp. SID1034]|nr:hypothetical protein [Streptomyces sp. SID1034]